MNKSGKGERVKIVEKVQKKECRKQKEKVKKQIIHESIRKNENDPAKYSKSQKFVLK